MELHSVFISNPAKLSVRQNQLVIAQEREVTIPIEDVSSLMLESRAVTLTAAALQTLADSGVTVFFCDETHLPAALLLPMNRHSRQLKLLKAQIGISQPLRKQLWQSIVTAKIQNQARCLEFCGKDDSALRELAAGVRSGDAGHHEAVAAALYFPALFGEEFTRGDECLINSALNYGYAIMRGAVARNLVCRGLEPCLGLFHHNELNQFNLADDLMEPFRPLVDLYVAFHLLEAEGDLTPTHKHQLFNLTNYVIMQDGKRNRMISAVGRCVESLARSVVSKENVLSLPSLLPLESFRYE